MNAAANGQLSTLKMLDLDILEEKSEQEEDGDKMTRENFYKSITTMDNSNLART